MRESEVTLNNAKIQTQEGVYTPAIRGKLLAAPSIRYWGVDSHFHTKRKDPWYLACIYCLIHIILILPDAATAILGFQEFPWSVPISPQDAIYSFVLQRQEWGCWSTLHLLLGTNHQALQACIPSFGVLYAICLLGSAFYPIFPLWLSSQITSLLQHGWVFTTYAAYDMLYGWPGWIYPSFLD